MLFDLEDYRLLGFIAGYDNTDLMKTPDQTNWLDPQRIFSATRDAFLKAINEYYFSSVIIISIEDRETFIKIYDDFLQKVIDFLPIADSYWESLICLPIKTLQPGQTFNIINDYTYFLTGYNYLSESNEEYPYYANSQVYVTETNIYTGNSFEYNLFTYTEYSKSLEQEYLTALSNVMAIAKKLVESCDGRISDV